MTNSILITGAASGIGEATARVFAEKGWTVGLVDLNLDRLKALSQSIAPGQSSCWFASVDVTDAEAVQQSVDDFTAYAGSLDVLFNSAGVLFTGHFEQVELAKHSTTVAVNVQGVMNCCYAAFHALKRSQGQVINMSSASALYGIPHFASYSASKFAVRGFTEALNIEWAPYGITVCDLMPPFVNTPMVSNQTFVAPVMEKLGVELSAEEIAQAVWKAVGSKDVHHPVGWKFKTLKQVEQFMPDLVVKNIIRFLSKP